MESQRREDILSQDIKSLTDLLKDAQHNLRISNEKIHQLSVGLIAYLNVYLILILFDLPKFNIRLANNHINRYDSIIRSISTSLSN